MNQPSPEKRHHNQCPYNRYPTLKLNAKPYTAREIDLFQSYYVSISADPPNDNFEYMYIEVSFWNHS